VDFLLASRTQPVGKVLDVQMPDFLAVLQEDIAAKGTPGSKLSSIGMPSFFESGSTVSTGRLLRFERFEAANIEDCARELLMLGDLDEIDHRRKRDTCDRM